MYSIKKHMMRDPNLKFTNISQLNKNQFDDLKDSNWAKYLINRKPGTVMKNAMDDNLKKSLTSQHSKELL